MTSRNRVATVFVVLQLVGITLSALWQQFPADIGMAFWCAALILLIPGNFLAAWIVEKALWQRGLSLTGLWALSSVLLFAFNALLWFMLIKAFGHIRARLLSSVRVQRKRTQIRPAESKLTDRHR
jgi:hypothetical protein